MTESKIFINGERPRIRHDPEPGYPDFPWRMHCPCGDPDMDVFDMDWRTAYDFLVQHVREEHL